MSSSVDKAGENIIGRGWAFPPAFDPHTGEVSMTSGEEDIMQSLHLLFSTQIGERVLELSYGSNLAPLLFNNISLSEKTVLESRIEQAILYYESRISLHQIEVDVTQIMDGIVRILIDFSINQTNNRLNMVFPFFIKEGTLIPGI